MHPIRTLGFRSGAQMGSLTRFRLRKTSPLSAAAATRASVPKVSAKRVAVRLALSTSMVTRVASPSHVGVAAAMAAKCRWVKGTSVSATPPCR